MKSTIVLLCSLQSVGGKVARPFTGDSAWWDTLHPTSSHTLSKAYLVANKRPWIFRTLYSDTEQISKE